MLSVAHSNPSRKETLVLLGTSVMLMMAACDIATTPGALPGNNIAPPTAQANEPVIKPIARDGNRAPITMAMADALLQLPTDPFYSKLTRPEPEPLPTVETPNNGPTPPPIVEVSPLESVTLLGISYNAKKPMAILQTENDGTLMVEAGQTIQVEGTALRIKSIRPNAVELSDTSTKKGESRKLDLPDVVGYRNSSSGRSEGASEDSRSRSPGASSGGGATPPDQLPTKPGAVDSKAVSSSVKSILDELQKP